MGDAAAIALGGELTGRCLCGAVRYSLRPGMRLNPYACHCTNCQSRTGSAFSEHMLFARADLSIEGALDTGTVTQPGGATATIHGCGVCRVRIYAETDARAGFASLRCGTLDASAQLVPAAHLWVRSKQPWIVLAPDARTLDEQPRTTEEWIALVGMVGATA